MLRPEAASRRGSRRRWRSNRSRREAHRLGTGGTHVNFLGLGDARVRDAYDADRYARLLELKRRWDPTNAFHLNQNIDPAAG